jgi:hypothetical protein
LDIYENGVDKNIFPNFLIGSGVGFNIIYPDNIIPITKNMIKITIDIRTKSRKFRNSNIFYVKFINDIYNKYKDTL